MENLSFRFYKPEELIINSIDSKLEDNEKLVRRYIMENIIDNKEPYNLLNDISNIKLKDLSKNEIESIYKKLVKKNIIVPDENNNINYVYPVSAIGTNHKITLEDGRSFTAMCAIDSIGTHFTFKQNIKINSNCSNTGEEIYLELKDGKIVDCQPKDLHILHVDLNKNQNWSGEC